jgi:hypothetical protein
MDLKATENEEWAVFNWWDFRELGKETSGSIKVGNILTKWGTVNFSRWSLFSLIKLHVAIWQKLKKLKDLTEELKERLTYADRRHTNTAHRHKRTMSVCRGLLAAERFGNS